MEHFNKKKLTTLLAIPKSQNLHEINTNINNQQPTQNSKSNPTQSKQVSTFKTLKHQKQQTKQNKKQNNYTTINSNK